MHSSTHKRFTCFVASPGDVMAEREACAGVIEEINRSFADKDISLQLIRWEKDANPAIGQDGQMVINEQLSPSSADFFIGIFWSRFGEPTPRAESGTEEEFNQAFGRWKATKDNHIMLFFKTADVSPSVDGNQLEKVKRFRDRAARDGALFRDFSTTEEFSQYLRESITKTLLKTIPDPGQPTVNDVIHKTLSDNLQKALSVFQEEIQWIDRFICDRIFRKRWPISRTRRSPLTQL